MSPGGNSKDPAARARSLANLRPNPEKLVAGAGAGRVGTAPALKSGWRTHSPQRSPEWSPAVLAAIGDLESRVGAELRDADGVVHSWAVPSLEACALQRVAAWRVDRYVAAQELQGRLKPADLDLASRITERYHRSLEREALTLSSRLAAMGAGRSLAELMSDLPDPDKKRTA